MNKKFSTLLASAMLATAFSAGAANPKKGDAVLLKHGGFVTVQKDANFGKLDASTSTVDKNIKLSTLNEATWTVSSKKTVLGKEVYTFVNKATGLTLAVDPTTAVDKGQTSGAAITLGGSASEWVLEGNNLVSYFKGDSVVYLGKNSDNSLFLLKGKSSDAITSLTLDNSTLAHVGVLPLTADDLNSLLQSVPTSKSFGLTMNPEVSNGQKNLLTASSLTAEAIEGTVGYVNLKAGKDKYVVVDTAYFDGTETNKFVKFAYDKLNADNRLKGAYNFKFSYNVAKDELYIQVEEVAHKYEKSGDALKEFLKKNNNSLWSQQGTDEELSKETNKYIYLARLAGTNILTVNTSSTVTNNQETEQRTVVKLGTNFSGLTLTTIPDGVYTVKYKATKGNANYDKNGAYALANLAGTFGWAEQAERQNFEHMPAAQWVVKKNGTSNTATVSIVNREFSDKNNILDSNAKQVLPSVAQFFAIEGSNDVYYYNNGVADTLSFVKISDELAKDNKLGYKYVSKEDAMVQTFTFNYLHGLSQDKFLLVDENGVVKVDAKDGKSAFHLEVVVADDKYGYDNAMVRNVYYVTDGSKYLSYNAAAKKYMMGSEKTPFFLKENNCVEGKHFYALVKAVIVPVYDNEGKATYHVTDEKIKFQGGTEVAYTSDNYALVKVSVDDNTLDLTEGNLNDKFIFGNNNEIRTSAFAVETDDSPLYRRFNNANLGEVEGTDSLMFVEKIRGEYLMDEWNSKLQHSTVDYAGIWTKDKAEGKLAFIVDTAWVNRGLGYIKPQYLISVARNDQKGTETIPCTYEHNHYDNAGNKVDAAHCSHATKGHPGFRYGKYLVSFGDSAIANEFKAPYMDIDGGYTRVGFVEAIHYNDSLIILTGDYEKADPAKLNVEDIIAAYKKDKKENLIVNLAGDNHKNVTWSFRYVTPSTDAVKATEEGAVNEFLFESNIYNAAGVPANVTNDFGKATKGFDKAKAGSIAPASAAWLKMQNGCLVLTRADSKFEAAKTGSDGALIFNAYKKSEADDMVTSNDEVAVEGVKVLGQNGSVVVLGAAGKNVTVATVLGKTVASQVIASDNATIAAPAGVVFVTVDGETTKVVVK